MKDRLGLGNTLKQLSIPHYRIPHDTRLKNHSALKLSIPHYRIHTSVERGGRDG